MSKERTGPGAPRQTEGVRAFKRGLDVLREVNRSGGIRAGDVARALDLPRPTVYRLLETLEELGYIARDSAHQTPPFLGQGMCAGIRDAANLAWKLAGVIRGGAAAELLDTYQSERLPHVREFIELAIRLGGVINTKAIEAGLAVGEARENAPVKLEVKKPLLGTGLALGDLPLAGHLAPQFMLSNGHRSDDRIGYHHVLLVETTTALPSRIALWQAGIEILTCDDAEGVGHWLNEHDIIAALVRPDRYIRGTARNEPELERLIAAVIPATHVPSAA